MNSRKFISANLFTCILIVYVLCFSMEVTNGRAEGSGSGSGSGSGTKPIDEGLCEFIVSEIMRGILIATPVMFRSIKEDVIELMEDHL